MKVYKYFCCDAGDKNWQKYRPFREKETQQQIRISLEWRKTVTNLVDENKRLKLSQFKIGKEKLY